MSVFHSRDLFEIAWLGDCDLSPDGRHVALTVTHLDRDADAYRSAIWLVEVATGRCRQFTAGTDRDSAPRWSPDGRWLAFLTKRPGEQEKPQLAVMPTDGGESRVITALGHGAGAPVWAPDSRRLAFSARTGTPPDPSSKTARPYRRITELKSRLNGEGWTYDTRRHLFVVDLDVPGLPAQITEGPWDDTAPCWSPDGERLAFVSARHDSRDRDGWTDVWTVAPTGGPATRITPTDAQYFAPAWSPDGRSMAMLASWYEAGGNATPHVGSAAGGRPAPVIASFDRQCGIGAQLSPSEAPIWLDGATLLTNAQDRGDTALVRLSPGGQAVWVGRAPRVVASHSARAGVGHAVFVASTPTMPSELFVVDLATGAARQLTQFNATWRSGRDVSEPQHLVVTVTPGVELDAWFMPPANRVEGQQYPVLLNVHGGPFTQYGRGFFDEFHVYTGAGYGVVYCNPRGSSGQSTEFARSIIGHLGEDDFRDVMACFDAALARMPWADRARLGVMGGSYGGFMTSWIIGHDHRFAAAISERAVNDWYTMQGTSDIGPSFNELYLGEGAAVENDVGAVLRQSPLTYAMDMRTPVLILHSEDDLRCPISQAEQLWVALKRLGRDVEFVRFPDEHHELSRSGRPSHRVDRFEVILEYLGRHLGVPVAPRS